MRQAIDNNKDVLVKVPKFFHINDFITIIIVCLKTHIVGIYYRGKKEVTNKSSPWLPRVDDEENNFCRRK